MSRTYIAVVKQPACYNVFRVVAGYEKRRLKQGSGAECVAFAEGYLAAIREYLMSSTLELRFFECDAGDAGVMEWRGIKL